MITDTSAGPKGPEHELVVRTATGDDLDAVLEVGHRTWPATYEPIAGPDYVALGLAKWWTADAVIPAIRTGRTLVADLDGVVVGLAVFGPHDDDMALWKLYVLPSHHSRGIGRALLQSVLERVREQGRQRIVAQVIDGNDRARRFYESHGFSESHREPAGTGLPDSIWMVRELSDDEEDGA